MVPVVSVCIITYNHESFIGRCLESVVTQKTNFPFEVVIGEDCSRDKTRTIVEEYANRYPDIVKPILHNKNVGGHRNAYEFCYPRLTGKYIAICEGDDFWTDPYKLQKQVDFLENNPECVLCFHRVNSVDAYDKILQDEQPAHAVTYYNWKNILHLSIPTLSVVYRNCIKEIPGEMYKVNSCDTFLFGMLSRYGGAADLGFVGASYRKHAGGVYNGLNRLNQYLQTIHTRKMMKRCTAFTKEQKQELGKEIVKRKILYSKYFFKKYEVLNSFRILFS
jgi:glycosyltransferase involved in cell wall biosynthesis